LSQKYVFKLIVFYRNFIYTFVHTCTYTQCNIAFSSTGSHKTWKFFRFLALRSFSRKTDRPWQRFLTINLENPLKISYYMLEFVFVCAASHKSETCTDLSRWSPITWTLTQHVEIESIILTHFTQRRINHLISTFNCRILTEDVFSVSTFPCSNI